MTRGLLTIAACILSSAALLAQGDARSTAPARELAGQLDARHLEAIAAADPQTPGRFIAALYIAPSQLLVVGARHPAADGVASKIRQQQFRDVYLDLQTTPAGVGKWFVHDLGADGLSRSVSTSVDNVYEGAKRIALVDGGAIKQDRFDRSDAEYARMLAILLSALQGAPAPAPGGAVQLTSK